MSFIFKISTITIDNDILQQKLLARDSGCHGNQHNSQGEESGRRFTSVCRCLSPPCCTWMGGVWGRGGREEEEEEEEEEEGEEEEEEEEDEGGYSTNVMDHDDQHNSQEEEALPAVV